MTLLIILPACVTPVRQPVQPRFQKRAGLHLAHSGGLPPVTGMTAPTMWPASSDAGSTWAPASFVS